MTTILLTGRDGQVGWELQRSLAPLGQLVACGRAELDLTSPDSIRTRVREVKPDIIVNAAAYTTVDKAESEPALAGAVNGVAPGILAEEARRLGALLVHYSTDYVFDGEKFEPYVENDAPNPLNEYGRSKLAGERAIDAAGCAHLIFRTTWVYAPRGKNFLLTILRLARERDELRIVADQMGAPTSAAAIAQATARVIEEVGLWPREPDPRWGVYHLAAKGKTSWFGFTESILDRAAFMVPARPRLTPIPSSEYPTPARRPRCSVLDCEKFHGRFRFDLAPWDQALDEVITELRSRPI
ncbi:MAG TPA: dTDP-4-dehydrorhamnose reductase [Burkholderiales bacterium]